MFPDYPRHKQPYTYQRAFIYSRKIHSKLSLARLILPLSLVALALSVMSCSIFPSSRSTGKTTHLPGSQTNPQVTPTPWNVQTGQLSPEIDQITRLVIQNISQHGWNAKAMMKGKVIGGLYINWQMNDPNHTNALRAGMDDATSGNHDPQVELFYLNAMAEYHSLHPQDHTYDQEIKKALVQVLGEFLHYNLPKGWVYFYLLRDGNLLHNDDLVQAAHNAAQNYFERWYDPAIGMVYNRVHTPGAYATEHSITAGAALIDAGKRWNQADWVEAGKSTLNKALQASRDPKTHLFYNNMTIEADGTQQVLNAQAKPSTQGSAVEALVKAYNDTHDQHYLDIADQTLEAVFHSDLWDQVNGGLFFAKNLKTGVLEQNYKETRSQIHILIGLYQYNQVLQRAGQQPRFLDKQQQLLDILLHRCYQPTYHGFFYRMTPDFQIYTSSKGSGIGYENFFTTEAMGLAMDALQQTEFSHLPL